LTIGIISGGVWANEHIELGSKETWALITWLVSLLIYIRITKVGKVKEQLFCGLGFFVI
jgi:ABC-type transport system involved in cytochrome c biogenesis permease subunit